MANAHVSVTMPPEMVERLDGFRGTQQPIPTRAEVVRQAVEVFLAQAPRQFRPVPSDVQGGDDDAEA